MIKGYKKYSIVNGIRDYSGWNENTGEYSEGPFIPDYIKLDVLAKSESLCDFLLSFTKTEHTEKMLLIEEIDASDILSNDISDYPELYN